VGKGDVYFAMKNNKRHIIILGVAALVLLYLVLCWMVLYYSGFTLYNLIICAMSGAIIFIPVRKRFFPKK